MKKKEITPAQKALNLWAIILIAWAFYRTYFKMPVWFDEFIAKPIVFVLPVFYFIRKIEKGNIVQGLYIKRDWNVFIKEFLISLAVGFILLMTAVISVFLKTRELNFLNNFPDFNRLGAVIILALVTGITEEILSRGFVLKRLYEESKNIYSASFYASILFFFLHVPFLFTNAKINGNLLLMFMATDILMSMVNGLVFLQRRSLTIPILIHAFYNIVISLVTI